MACLALTSLKESIEPLVNSSTNHFSYDSSVVLYSLDAKVIDSLQIVKCLSKRSDSAEQFKLVEEKVRIAACEAEYSSQQFTQHDNLSLKILLSKVDDIEFLITDLLKNLGPKFFNLEEQLSYVVSSSPSNSYEIHHEFVVNYIKYRSSYLKKLRRMLCMLARIASPIRVEKNELVDFLISNVNSDLLLLGINIDGSGSGMEHRNLARYIYTDTRMKNSFPIHAWVTVFFSDQTKDLLKCLLHSVMEDFSFNETYQPRLGEMSSQQLYECLYSHLEGQRYFIVIDSLEDPPCDSISYPFPDKKNGSRIIFTNNVGMAFGITSKINLVLSSLEEGQLHKMFHNLVFGGRRCPGELKTMVWYILNSCQGSPFAVFMIAKYLSTINQTTDNWLIVRESIQNRAYMFSNLVHGIISALLKASEDNNSIHAEERSVFTQKCEAKNKHPERFKHLSASSEVAKANDYEHVGLEECLDQLVPELLRSSSSPQLEKVAIAGMAGIGKTTLAKRIFDDTSISDHFHIRAWIRISQFYRKRSLLIQLLQDITQLTDSEILNESDAHLEEKLYKCLKGQRYLIIMDDVWSIEAWSELKRTFPDDKMGSRILLTSRESNLIESLGCKIIHRMSLLSEKNSWGLLQKKVFGQEICPQGLAAIGKQIAERCEGLPLAIVVVAGVLSKIGKTVDNWKVVAVSVSSHVMGSENATRAIFSLSYEHLPDCLKSCFLYMGAFPGGYEIEVRKLIRLWIAEGFISNAYPKSLEDIAEEYLDDLIGRSLLLSGRRRSNGKVKTCRLHDLVLEFCVQEARKDKFLDVIKDFRLLDSQAANDGQHRFSFHCHTFDDVHLTASKSHACSALFFLVSSHLVPDILLPYFDFKLLRVLHLISWRFDNFPTKQVERLLLRYLALTASFELPGQLFRLQKLQTLIINGPWLWSYKIPILPPEIWRSTSLRHLQLRVANHLVTPEKSTEAKYLDSLQTLTKITLGSCTHETFSSIPYVLELGVCETHEDLPVVGLWDSFFQNLVLLKHIQTLKISCFGHGRPLPLRSLDAFPKGLKKLTLRHSNLPWEAITLIGDLPNLEVLKLRNNAFKGPEWETREGGFQKLKYLLIEETDLRHWELESHHFPHLEQLVLKCCEVLEEIPTEIGDIPTLAHIKLDNCCSSVERSAKDIREEQSEYGHDIKIKIRTQQTLSSTSLKEMDE
ncbi:antimicrobial response protein [Lithospermum erythrorhizon]|uniref:Antimicrobial response protein n=1 Tax=Lithospermum erythrorhizon TaxID=34254 RepID=A0AAV3PPW1_LITER